jgi:hypothetical protein
MGEVCPSPSPLHVIGAWASLETTNPCTPPFASSPSKCAPRRTASPRQTGTKCRRCCSRLSDSVLPCGNGVPFVFVLTTSSNVASRWAGFERLAGLLRPRGQPKGQLRWGRLSCWDGEPSPTVLKLCTRTWPCREQTIFFRGGSSDTTHADVHTTSTTTPALPPGPAEPLTLPLLPRIHPPPLNH